ncbi:hypothetical protein ACFLXI_09110 [Chloroflexota bacterium]
MENKHKYLLLIDGIANLVLGILLLLFPLGIAEFVGAPLSVSHFYPTILGGVIFGIGVALLIERYGFEKGIRGLGLGGAIAINICGALVLLGWLVLAPPAIPLRGSILLWGIGILVLGIGLVELATKFWKYA